jgi:tRNA nucleotidyltransferase (CCA-adding enzyme)
MLLASECDARGRGDIHHEMRSRAYPQRPYLLGALEAARAVNAGDIAAGCGENKERIPEAIHRARVRAVSEWIASAEGGRPYLASAPGSD